MVPNLSTIQDEGMHDSYTLANLGVGSNGNIRSENGRGVNFCCWVDDDIADNSLAWFGENLGLNVGVMFGIEVVTIYRCT